MISFLAQLVTTLSSLQLSEQENNENEETPLTTLLTHVASTSNALKSAQGKIRARACMIIAEIMATLPKDAEIEYGTETMLYFDLLLLLVLVC